MEEEREDSHLQVVCYWAGDETGELEFAREKTKESEDHLPDFQAGMARGFSVIECLWVLVAETKERIEDKRIQEKFFVVLWEWSREVGEAPAGCLLRARDKTGELYWRVGFFKFLETFGFIPIVMMLSIPIYQE